MSLQLEPRALQIPEGHKEEKLERLRKITEETYPFINTEMGIRGLAPARPETEVVSAAPENGGVRFLLPSEDHSIPALPNVPKQGREDRRPDPLMRNRGAR
jgi:hypothetical protein